MKSLKREEGQGLVEYALILVLVALVVIAALLLLGPTVGNAFSNVVNALNEAAAAARGSGPITSVTADWNGPTVRVRVTVSTPTNVSVSVVQGSGTPSGSQACSGTCTFSVSSPSTTGGRVRASAGGGSMTADWPSQ